MARSPLGTALALGSFLLCATLAHGALRIVSSTMAVGPSLAGTPSFSTINTFLDDGLLSGVGFASNNDGVVASTGLSVQYYPDVMVNKGLPMNKAFIQEITDLVVTVSIAWQLTADGIPGRIASLTFTQKDGTRFTLGASVGAAQSQVSTFTAPPGSYLGAFHGTASNTSVQSLGVIWVKFVDATTPTVSGYGPWWIAGDKTGAKYFDDTAIAKAQALPINKLAGVFGPLDAQSGITVFYGDRSVVHGDFSVAHGARDNYKFTKVTGQFVYDKRFNAGYWGQLIFTTNANTNVTIGKPITGSPTGLTLISERAPTAKSYLGAFQGYSRLNPVAQLVALKLVWFTD